MAFRTPRAWRRAIIPPPPQTMELPISQECRRDESNAPGQHDDAPTTDTPFMPPAAPPSWPRIFPGL